MAIKNGKSIIMENSVVTTQLPKLVQPKAERSFSPLGEDTKSLALSYIQELKFLVALAFIEKACRSFRFYTLDV